MMKSVAAVTAAAAIAGAFTLLSAGHARLEAGVSADPVQTASTGCAQRAWPYLNCIGTPSGNPGIRLVTTDKLAS